MGPYDSCRNAVTYKARVSVSPPGGAPVPVDVDVLDDAISFSSGDGQAQYLSLIDIDDVFDDNYTLRLTDFTGRRYDFSMLGRVYGQVLADVTKRRNAALQHDLLLTGINLQDTYPAKIMGRGSPIPAEIRLFQDLMLIVPERGLMWGVPFSYVGNVRWNEDLYQVTVAIEGDEPVTFGQMGKRTTQFRDDLERLIGALRRKTAETLTQLMPGTASADIAQLSVLMPDGRAAQQKSVEAISEQLWHRLEGVVAGSGDRRQSYDWLKAHCPPGWPALGVKALTFGDTTVASSPTPAPDAGSAADDDGEDGVQPDSAKAQTWFFCPLSRDGAPINAVAQEVTSEAGHATYFFRLLEPASFAALKGEDLAVAVSKSLMRLNRGLATLNFRRQPIYLSEDAIQQGAFAMYRVALRRLDYLQWIRQAFLGRAIHNDSWEQQATAIVDSA